MATWQSNIWFETCEKRLHDEMILDPNNYFQKEENQTMMLEIALYWLERDSIMPTTDTEIISVHRNLIDGTPPLEYCNAVRRRARELQSRVGDVRGLAAWIARAKNYSREVSHILKD